MRGNQNAKEQGNKSQDNHNHPTTTTLANEQKRAETNDVKKNDILEPATFQWTIENEKVTVRPADVVVCCYSKKTKAKKRMKKSKKVKQKGK